MPSRTLAPPCKALSFSTIQQEPHTLNLTPSFAFLDICCHARIVCHAQFFTKLSRSDEARYLIHCVWLQQQQERRNKLWPAGSLDKGFAEGASLLYVFTQHSYCQFWTLAHFWLFNFYFFQRIIVIVKQDEVTQCRSVMARTTVYRYPVRVHKRQSRISEYFENQILDNLRHK